MSRSYRFLIGLTLILGLLGASGCGYTFQNSRSTLYDREGIRKIYIAPLVNDTFKAGVENIVHDQLLRILSASGKVIIVQREEDADAILRGGVGNASYGVSGSTGIGSLPPLHFDTSKIPITAFGVVAIATEYTATLSCNFNLSTNPIEKRSRRRKFPIPFVGDFEPMTGPDSFRANRFGDSTPKLQNLAEALPEIVHEKKGKHLKEAAKQLAQDVVLAKVRPPYSWSASFSRSKPFPAANQLDVPGTTSSLINDSEFERALSDLAHDMMYDVNEAMLAMF